MSSMFGSVAAVTGAGPEESCGAAAVQDRGRRKREREESNRSVTLKSSRSDVFASQTVMDQSYIKRESRPGCPVSRCTVQTASAAAHNLTSYSHHNTLFTISGLPLKRSKSYIFQSYNCFESSITLLNNFKTNVTTTTKMYP